METISTKVAISKDEEGKSAYREVNVNYDFGANLTDFTTACGEEATFLAAVSAARVSLQGRVRALAKSGLPDEDIQKEIDTWVYGIATRRISVDPKLAIVAEFKTYSDEQKAAFLKELGIDLE